MSVNVFVLMGLLLAMTTAIGYAEASGSSLKVYNAYFMADELRPNYKWREGWSLKDEKGRTADYADHFKRGGCFQIYLKNTADRPVSIDTISLDGVALDESIKRLETIWYKVWENPVPAGGIAEIRIRQREIKSKVAKVVITSGDGNRTELVVPLESPRVLVDSISFAEASKRLFVYASTMWMEDSIVDVEFDGKSVSSKSRVTYPLTGGLLPLTLKFDKSPLVYGSFHTLKIKTASGSDVAVTFRVLDDFFSRSTFAYNWPPKSEEDRLKAAKDFNLICANGVKDWGDTFRYWQFNDDTKESIEEWAKKPLNYLHYLSPDEPDCQDFYREEVADPYLKLGAYGQEVVAGTLLRYNYDKDHPTGLVVDNTYKPANYYTYARISDILIPDPYSTEAGEPPTYVYNVVDLCQLSARPAQVWAILFCTEDRESWNGYYRYPSNSEMRMSTYYALGRGVKGISYWWYCVEGAYHGLIENRGLWDEISRLMTEVRVMEKFLASASYVPGNLAHTPNQRVRLLSLLNSQQGCAVAVINDDFLMTSKKFETNPVKDVEISVRYPDWQDLKDVYLLDSGTTRKIAHTRKNGEIRVRLDEVASASMLVFATPEGCKHIEANLQREIATQPACNGVAAN